MLKAFVSLIFRYIGPYVTYSLPKTIFVAVEQSNPKRTVAVVTATLNARQFADKVPKFYIFFALI